MKLEVRRFEFMGHCTIGKLFVDGADSGIFTLEDTVREVAGFPVDTWKIKGETAIPRGAYRVIIDFSNHFQKNLPHILNVPGFEGVRIHSGNTDGDTEGCILLGKTWHGGDFIGESRDAFMEILPKIVAASWVGITIS